MENAKLAIGLTQAFKVKKPDPKGELLVHIVKTDIPIPFEFPIFDSYDMDLATELGKKSDLPPQRIFSVLVQIIYELLQFHVRRLFELDPSEPFVPNPDKDISLKWRDTPQNWFAILLDAVMPGAMVKQSMYDEPIKVNSIHVKPFQFLNNGDATFEYSTHKNGISGKFKTGFCTEIPAVSIHTLPTRFLGKEIAADQPIFTAISLKRSYPHCKKILHYLLKGITFAFDLRDGELKVVVTPTGDIPSIEESMNTLKVLFEAPIETQIMVPEDIEYVLRNRVVPKASCYHPDKMPFRSPALYERMLTLIVAGGMLLMLKCAPDSGIGAIASDLNFLLKLYLPDSSIMVVTSMEYDISKVSPCTYAPQSSSMWICKEDVSDMQLVCY